MKWKDWDRNLRIRLYGEGVMNFMFWSFFPFMTILFKDAFGEKQAGLLLMLSQVASVCANLVGGYCADRFGRKRMMVFAAMGETATFVLFAYANSPWLSSPMLTFLSFGLLGVFGAIYWPASHAMVADVVDEKNRASVFAVFYTTLNIAVVVGPIIGGMVFFSYRFEMLCIGVLLSATLTFILHIFLEETSTPAMRNKEEKKKWYTAIADELADYRIIAKDKTLLLFIFSGVLIAQTFMQLDILIAVYTSDQIESATLLNLGNWQWTLNGAQSFSLVLAVNGLIVALFTVFITKRMSKRKEKHVFIASSLLYAIAITLYGMTDHLWFMIGCMVLFTIAELMVAGIQESFVAKLSPKEMRGQYFSAASLRFTLGRLLAPMSLIFIEWFSYATVFAIIGSFALLSAVMYYGTFKRFEAQQLAQKPSHLS
ncbi:MDR family MFS transporter [Pontibacillus litoralis]|uniref:MFS transporter n=1 Tax=Pontibacillus litoralis JSM 072002 TaxID=1385512 RepID=A0A0A5G2A3_9BACI|nr:MFS transporter [Pontibacillus litoralis]KGX85278.1 MFS transporter [Pontibacillus litoralis JSM 072002]